MSAQSKKNPVESVAAREEPSNPGLHAVPSRQAAPFSRVPTHAIGFGFDRRTHARAALNLPLRLRRVGNREEPVPVTLLTRNISSSGVYFLAPRHIEAGTHIELEVALVDRPLGQGSVRMCTSARVVRVDPAQPEGWHGLAVTFDDIAFDRDESVPPR